MVGVFEEEWGLQDGRVVKVEAVEHRALRQARWEGGGGSRGRQISGTALAPGSGWREIHCSREPERASACCAVLSRLM